MSGASKVQLLAIALKAAMVLAGLCSTASAQVAKVTTTKCHGTYCTIGSGTCVHIGTRNGRGYFLTAGHVVAGAGTAVIDLRDGKVQARIEAADEDPDLGLLSVPDNVGLESAFPVAEEVAGESFELVGFTRGGPFVRRSARLLRRAGGLLVCAVQSDSGDSGGPYLDGNRVVGIHMGVAADGKRATDCVTIRRWLTARVGFIPCPPVASQPVPQRPQPGPPVEPTPATPPQVTCGCAFEIATLKAEIAALKAKCNAPVTPPPPPAPPSIPGEVTKRLEELEARIAFVSELTKRIDALEFKIGEVRIAGGKTEQLEKELAALRDLTFEVRSLAPDGKVVSSETKRLGDNIDLRLVPKRQN